VRSFSSGNTLRSPVRCAYPGYLIAAAIPTKDGPLQLIGAGPQELAMGQSFRVFHPQPLAVLAPAIQPERIIQKKSRIKKIAC